MVTNGDEGHRVLRLHTGTQLRGRQSLAQRVETDVLD